MCDALGARRGLGVGAEIWCSETAPYSVAVERRTLIREYSCPHGCAANSNIKRRVVPELCGAEQSGAVLCMTGRHGGCQSGAAMSKDGRR
jgi:hypothetical protein